MYFHCTIVPPNGGLSIGMRVFVVSGGVGFVDVMSRGDRFAEGRVIQTDSQTKGAETSSTPSVC